MCFLHKFNNSAIAGFTFALYDPVNKIKYLVSGHYKEEKKWAA